MTTTSRHSNLPDPAELIVAAGCPRPGLLRDELRRYADRLTATGVFTDLTVRDTCWLATVIAWEVVEGDESSGLRQRAATASGWHNHCAVEHALITAATILDVT